MGYTTITFMIFMLLVTAAYYMFPAKKYQWTVLLVASYIFYLWASWKYAAFLLFTTFTVYFASLIMYKNSKTAKETIVLHSGEWDREQKKQYKEEMKRKRRKVLIMVLVLNFGILIFLKYFNLFAGGMNSVIEKSGMTGSIPILHLALPLGISFYTFQSAGYLIDVYREKIEPERNPAKSALFVSFFPQLVAGPIERSTNLLSQFKSPIRFDAGNVTKGLQIMLWGYVEKVVIADNLAILVDTVYGDYNAYSGSMLVLASALFAIQIYCDFGGYSHIAIGAAKVLGVTLMDNFRQPFFARSIREHWRRWHISLSGWFRDYLYIPLGGSRCSKGRKYLNVMITFLASGMWHGASLHYIIWGGLHGGYQVIGEMMTPLKKKIWELLHINPEHIVYQTLQRVITFFLIVITFVVFRANSFRESLEIFKIIVLRFEWSRLIDGSVMNLGLVPAPCLLVIVALILLLAVDILHERGVHFSLWISEKPRAVRWGVYYVLTFLILVSILQTFGQSASSFLYFQF